MVLSPSFIPSKKREKKGGGVNYMYKKGKKKKEKTKKGEEEQVKGQEQVWGDLRRGRRERYESLKRIGPNADFRVI